MQFQNEPTIQIMQVCLVILNIIRLVQGILPRYQTQWPQDIHLYTALVCVDDIQNKTELARRTHIKLARNMADILPTLLTQSETAVNLLLTTTYDRLFDELDYNTSQRLKKQLQSKTYWRLFLKIHPGSGIYSRARYNKTITLLCNQELLETMEDEIRGFQQDIEHTDMTNLLDSDNHYSFHWKLTRKPELKMTYVNCPEMLKLAIAQEKRAFLKQSIELCKSRLRFHVSPWS